MQPRAVEKDDLTFLHKLFNRDDVMDYWFSEAHMSMEHLQHMFEKNTRNEQSRSFILEAGQTQLGYAVLSDIDWRHRHAEFSIMIDPSHQGNGYAGEATRLVLDHAFFVLNLHKLYLIVAKANEKARHIYEKAGFRVEGEMAEHFFVKGYWQNALIMAILQQDYAHEANNNV